MSSLAAARADNFYHPPDWDPRKESRAEVRPLPLQILAMGTELYVILATPQLDLRKQGKGGKQDKWRAHPLRERAKKLDEGILTIRFEMPFDVRCTGCNNRIGKGVRFNAEKKSVGKYFSTTIWSFRMLCHCEDGAHAVYSPGILL